MLLVKKYPNRRLYDTRNSRYITLDDLEKTVRAGEDVAVQDAQDGRDLTQETLTQIILDRGGGKILPASLLMRMIRLDDAALGEFLTRYVSWALEVYLQAKGRARAFLPLNPLATAPFAATDALARLVLGASQWGRSAIDPTAGQREHVMQPTSSGGGNAWSPTADVDAPMPPPPIEPEFDGTTLDVAPMQMPTPPTMQSAAADLSDEMQRMRREIEALKESMGAPARASAKKKAAPKKKKTSTKRA